MMYGKWMAAAMIGGVVLVGCDKKSDIKDTPSTPTNVGGQPTPEANKMAGDMSKKFDDSKKTMGDKAKEATDSAMDKGKSAMDNMKGMMPGATTQPTVPALPK